jgi:hypothetical protein
MAGAKKPAGPAVASAPKRTTKSKAARHAEATGTVAEVVKRADENGKALQGRPSVMTEATKAEILKRIAAGETLMQVCESPHLPERSTVIDYSKRDDAFSADLTRARADWAVAQADIIVGIIDDSSNDWEEKRTFGGATETRLNREAVERSKARVEVRKWLMERFLPKAFSVDATKLTGDHTDAASTIKQDATVIAPDEPGPDKPVL